MKPMVLGDLDRINKLIQTGVELSVWRRYDGDIQADIGNHHAAGKTVGEALERLEIYLMSLTANDGGVEHG